MDHQDIMFQGIRPIYIGGEDIPVFFKLTHPTLLCEWRPKLGDCVAICKVNSGKLSACLSNVMITREFIEYYADKTAYYIVFDKNKLPTDMEAEYEFVYFSNDGSIKGTSTTFRFGVLETRNGEHKPIEVPLTIIEKPSVNHQDIMFQGIRPIYIAGEDIPVHFKLTHPTLLCEWRPKLGDCVAICKVINSSKISTCMTRRMITREFIIQFENKTEYYVVFDKIKLPNDMEAEYEFVYFSNDGSIKGTSTTFRFGVLETRNRSLGSYISGEHLPVEVPSLPLSKEYFFDKIEKELLKQNESLTPTLEKSKVDNETFLTKLKLNPLQYVKTIEEILNENIRLTKTLEKSNKELVELRDEHNDIKLLISDLIKKLSVSERQVDTNEREKRSVDKPSTPVQTQVYHGLERFNEKSSRKVPTSTDDSQSTRKELLKEGESVDIITSFWNYIHDTAERLIEEHNRSKL